MKKILYIIIFSFFGCSNQVMSDFNSTDFPILVSCTEENSSIECYWIKQYTLNAIEGHNDLLNKEVFEWIDEDAAGDIDVTGVTYIKNDDGSLNYGVDAQTIYDNDQIKIYLSSRLFILENEVEQKCVLMHELGHALGYHGHNEEDGTLMSETADCETEGWYDDFYDWFQENYGE